MRERSAIMSKGTSRATKAAQKLQELEKDARAKQKVADKAISAANKAWAKVDVQAAKVGAA